MLAEYGLALLAVVCIAANGQDLTDAVDSRPLSRAPHRFLTEVRYRPNCPAGYWDKTYGNAFSWACGRGCPGGAYTWNDCSCACIFGTPPPQPVDPGATPGGGGGGGGGNEETTRRVIYSTSSWTFPPTGPPPEEPDDDGIDLGMVFAIGFAGFAFVMICSVCLAYALIMYSRSLEEEQAANTGPRPRVIKAMSRMGKGLDQRYQSGRNVLGRRFSMDMLGAPGKQLMRRLSMTMGFGGGSKQEPVARTLGPDFETDANGEEKLRVSGKVDVDQAMVTGVIFYPYKEGVPTVEQRSQPITPQSGVSPRSHISGTASHRSGHSGGGAMGRVQSDGGAQMTPMLSGPPTQRRAISATPAPGEPQRFVSSSAPIGAFSPSGGPRRRSLSPSHQGARRDSRGSGTSRASRTNQQPRRPSEGTGSQAGGSMGPTRSNRSQQPSSPNMGPMRSNLSQQPHNPTEPYSQGNMGKMPSNRSAASAVSSARPVPSPMSRNVSPAVPGQMSRYASPNVPSPVASRGLSPSYVPGAVHASPRGGAR